MPKISITPAVSDPYIVRNLKVPLPKPVKDTPKVKTKKARSKVIAVDFDGTLHNGSFPYIGEPNQELIDMLRCEQHREAKLILWTCRSGSFLDAAVLWCRDQGLVFDAINDNLEEVKHMFRDNPRKVFADVYIDDCAYRGDELCNTQP